MPSFFSTGTGRMGSKDKGILLNMCLNTYYFYHFPATLRPQKMAENRYNIEIGALGAAVRRYRRKKGWTQVDLEAATGITQADLSRIENGTLDLQFSSIVRLAEALDVPTKSLVGGDGSEDSE